MKTKRRPVDFLAVIKHASGARLQAGQTSTAAFEVATPLDNSLIRSNSWPPPQNHPNQPWKLDVPGQVRN